MVEAVSEQGRLTVWGKCQHIGPWASLPAEPFASLHHKGYRQCQLQLDQTMPSSPLTLPTYLYTPPSPSVFLCLFISVCFFSNADMFYLRLIFPNSCEMHMFDSSDSPPVTYKSLQKRKIISDRLIDRLSLCCLLALFLNRIVVKSNNIAHHMSPVANAFSKNRISKNSLCPPCNCVLF